MRHLPLGIAVPSPFDTLLHWLAELPRPRNRVPDLDGCLYDIDPSFLALVGLAPPSDALNVGYYNDPFELVNVLWNGGDGLRYGWVVHAPELDLPDFPAGSWAPVDDGEVLWLGDNTRQMLETLMLGNQRAWERYGELTYTERPAWHALCERLGLAPDLTRTDVKPGARVSRPVVPRVPEGWRFERGPDGVGVLAPEAAFAPGPVERDPEWYEDDHIEHARAHLDAGHPATALAILKETRFENDNYAPTIEAMRDAYTQLQRPLHALRAEKWLEEFGDG